MPTLSALSGTCAVADTCAAETGLRPCPVLAVASVTGESEVAPVSALAFLAYVLVYGWIYSREQSQSKLNKAEPHKTEQRKTKESKRDRTRPDQIRSDQQNEWILSLKQCDNRELLWQKNITMYGRRDADAYVIGTVRNRRRR